mmetsp:Transcript_3900/g.4594  ORF Transcript_3900/g.4594 Transcript_3900/m.4594 type:complete len:155 (+) Transcript_3900:63-527(+)|eukprot:CAMPEP_0170467796 /NCGR_PEP_ID=MMETSP0123-20130129/11240_1 /TAXON_ID=182087 /ORGANISM="Favella ehrenbergii, Strain Fehren 1" /LENGTH=154 /DNA_ID=CAMNT_0010734251 /DNA_START=45 /DNA_END=509 /DNA_ORIENTATION=-
MVEPQDMTRWGSGADTHTAYFERQKAKLEQLIAALFQANEADDKKLLDGVELLLKLTSNITKSPTESKYRTIRCTIAKIWKTLFALPGGVPELIQALGFVKVDEEHYVFTGDYFKVLRKGMFMLERAIEPIRVKYMTPEDKVKWEQLQESKRVF